MHDNDMGEDERYWRSNLAVCLLGSFTTIVAMTLLLPFLPIYVEQLAILRNGPAVLVCVTDPGTISVTDAYLRDESGLTAAEARVARLLVDGKTLRHAAAELDVSYSTVRNQLMRIFEKTGATRQAELVAMLLRRQTAAD